VSEAEEPFPKRRSRSFYPVNFMQTEPVLRQWKRSQRKRGKVRKRERERERKREKGKENRQKRERN